MARVGRGATIVDGVMVMGPEQVKVY